MLNLDSPLWSELHHAYGSAENIPELLRQLSHAPESSNDQEPWFSLWSALAHQGDVFTASFAAVPHVVAAIIANPLKVDFAYFQFPAWVEICRVKNQTVIPDTLSAAYFDALSSMPALVAAASGREWDDAFMASVLAAIAVSKGRIEMAEALLEMTPEVAGTFLDWFYQQ
ncbi:hypothetical protein KSF73_04905 [Burkholderiaceae bacterium DAT-1]|nr:hypothetical protein [Burkholderiaceae bacterium DAT-1]